MQGQEHTAIYQAGSKWSGAASGLIGGVVMVLLIMSAIPVTQLMKKEHEADTGMELAEFKGQDAPPPPPPTSEMEESKPEEPVEEMPEDTPQLDLAVNLPSIGIGDGGGFLIDTDLDLDALKPKKAAEGGLEFFDAKDLDEPPRSVVRTNPVYPKKLLKARVAGLVEVEMLVDENGGIVSTQIKKSSDEAFSEAALAALKQWKFKPGTKKGRPVKTRVLQPIAFKLG